MLIASAPLYPTATALRNGTLDLRASIEEVCDRIETSEPFLNALLPEPGRRARLQAEADALQTLYPEPTDRPPLYGVLLGVKDLFSAAGFPTRAGSQLPATLFASPEATCVTRLRKVGALIIGKTVSAEFALSEPGATRNPYNIEHTPGGSSSGSAAAVAAGFCSLALGTQTIGSIIRPAAFCGIVGFKPSYGRIATDGIVPCAPSLDTVGFFTQDTEGVALVAPLLCEQWQSREAPLQPVLGVPDGPYLAQASPEVLQAFAAQIVRLEEAGYTIRHVPILTDIETFSQQHMQIVFAEMAQQHAEWFAQFASLYRPRTTAAIQAGQAVSPTELATARAGRLRLQNTLATTMTEHGIDLWLCPAAPGPAPQGIITTGDPALNLPWTYAGMPVMTFPMGYAANGLPLGLQIVGAFMADEQLIPWVQQLQQIL